MIYRYEGKIYSAWSKGIGNASKQKLSKPLIIRDKEKRLITVNFDPEVGLPNILLTTLIILFFLCGTVS